MSTYHEELIKQMYELQNIERPVVTNSMKTIENTYKLIEECKILTKG